MLLPYCDLKIPALIFTSHTIPHITLDKKESLNSCWEFATLKKGLVFIYLWELFSVSGNLWCQSEIYDRTISLRFLGIILRVLRREVFVSIS